MAIEVAFLCLVRYPTGEIGATLSEAGSAIPVRSSYHVVCYSYYYSRHGKVSESTDFDEVVAFR